MLVYIAFALSVVSLVLHFVARWWKPAEVLAEDVDDLRTNLPAKSPPRGRARLDALTALGGLVIVALVSLWPVTYIVVASCGSPKARAVAHAEVACASNTLAALSHKLVDAKATGQSKWSVAMSLAPAEILCALVALSAEPPAAPEVPPPSAPPLDAGASP